MKNSCSFHIFAEDINCGYVLEPPRRGGFNECPQSMFLSRNTKINLQFYCIKKSGNCQVFAEDINCGYLLEQPRRGGFNEYPQFMVLRRNTKINPQFYCIKVGFKGGQNYIDVSS